MACSFSLPFDGTPEEMFPVARRAILKQGGAVDGTSRAGSAVLPTIAGEVAVNYTISAGALSIVVTDKPMLVSCAQIQDGFRKAIAQAPVPKARTPAPAPPVIDVIGEEAEAPRGKVIEIPVTVIEGRVPKPEPAPGASFLLPLVLVLGTVGLLAWMAAAPPRRYRRARA
jgi:hypothetical protein